MAFDLRRVVGEELGFVGGRRPCVALDHLDPARAADGAAPAHAPVRYRLAKEDVLQAFFRRRAQRASLTGGELYEEATDRARHGPSFAPTSSLGKRSGQTASILTGIIHGVAR